jgi:hypothetical protein
VPGGDGAAQHAERILGAPELKGGLAAAGEPLGVVGVDVQDPAVERVGFGVAPVSPLGVSEPQRFGRRDRPQARGRRGGRRGRTLVLAPETLLTATLCPIHGLSHPDLSDVRALRRW